MYATQQSCTDVGRWHTIYNCVDTAQYNWCPRVADDAPLVFLGRLEAIKGAHLAIEIARQAGRKLVLAGNRVEAGDNTGYFEAQVAPHIDGQTVTYIGPVDDAAKNDVLGKAAALVMPIVWDEPFGIVMAEAMACGTPVIGFARGSVPEVVQNGATGFVVHDVAEAAAAVAQLSQIDRGRVRAECEQRFDFRPITAQYERLYQQLVERCGAHTRERA
jgi:glycosyltransferase involved in cell wall biosynthesis